MMPAQFIAALSAPAQASMAITGVPASFTVAEAALESGWGSSQLAAQAFNLFGVKADPSWHGDTLQMNTREFLNGAWCMVPASWRKYPDWLSCLEDHAAFLTSNPRYHGCFACTDGIGFAQAVAAAGYATDPDYAAKLAEIINAHNLLALDAPAQGSTS